VTISSSPCLQSPDGRPRRRPRPSGSNQTLHTLGMRRSVTSDQMMKPLGQVGNGENYPSFDSPDRGVANLILRRWPRSSTRADSSVRFDPLACQHRPPRNAIRSRSHIRKHHKGPVKITREPVRTSGFDTFGTPSGNVRCLRVAAVYFVAHLRRSLFTGWPTRWALSGHHTAPMGPCPRSRGFWMRRRLKDKAGTTIRCVESETRPSLPREQFCASA
jgi:hypothetical protein